MRGIAIVTLLMLVLSLGCKNSQENSSYGEATATINGFEFDAEVPLTLAGFYQGLMYRESLADDKAMLFPYPNSATRHFWMKNTLIPLDIIYIDENLTITDVHHAIPCTVDPCEIYRSTAPVQYVLELRAGIASEYKIKRGDRVNIEFIRGGPCEECKGT